MGRNLFGPVHGGAWGYEHGRSVGATPLPYHYPVILLHSSHTHHPRDPVEMREGPLSTVTPTNRVRACTGKGGCGGKDVMLWCGATPLRQYLACWTAGTNFAPLVPCELGDVLASSTTSGRGCASLSRSVPSSARVTHLIPGGHLTRRRRPAANRAYVWCLKARPLSVQSQLVPFASTLRLRLYAAKQEAPSGRWANASHQNVHGHWLRRGWLIRRLEGGLQPPPGTLPLAYHAPAVYADAPHTIHDRLY